jgi:hypothetical protein
VEAPSAGTRFVLYTPQPLTNTGSNPYTFTNVPTGVYAIEGYYKGTFFGEEYWAVENVSVSAGQTSSAILTRHYPFVESIELRAGGSGGPLLGGGQTIAAGTQVWVGVTVRNNVSTQLSTQIHLLLDRSRSAPYEHDLISGFNSISSGNTRRFEFTLTPSTLGDYYYAYETKTRLLNGQTRRTDSAGWSAQPAFTVSQPLPPLDPGKWTVIVHGFKWTGSAAYADLIKETGWMYRIADALKNQTSTPVGIHSMNSETFEIGDLNGISITNTAAHHVVLFNWTKHSNDLGSDRHGWAYAAGESLYVFLKYHNAVGNVKALFGHSRGAVVVSETARRLILANAPPEQVVFLDGEGEGVPLSGPWQPLIFNDDRFVAWEAPATMFDNIYTEFDEGNLFNLCFPPLDLGGNVEETAWNQNLQELFAHGQSCSSSNMLGVQDFIMETIAIVGGSYTWDETRGIAPRPPTANPLRPLDPSVEPIDVFYNGDFHWESLAGWDDHGGSGSAPVVQPFPNHGQGYALKLDAFYPIRSHGFFIMPSDATEFRMKFKAAGLFRAGELVGTLTASGVPPQELVRRSLTPATPTFESVRELVDPRFQGRVCRFTIAVNNTPLNVYVDDIDFVSASACYADCDQSTGVGVLDMIDFLCFQQRFVANDPYACECDTFTGVGVCDLFDFLCFQNAFVTGCP